MPGYDHWNGTEYEEVIERGIRGARGARDN